MKVKIEPEKTPGFLSNGVTLLNISAAGTINSECLCLWLIVDLLQHFYDQKTKFLTADKNLIMYTCFSFYLHNYPELNLAFFFTLYVIMLNIN